MIWYDEKKDIKNMIENICSLIGIFSVVNYLFRIEVLSQ